MDYRCFYIRSILDKNGIGEYASLSVGAIVDMGIMTN